MEKSADWIMTFNGREFSPLNPRPEDVNIMDIAHSLAMQCRFTGHTRGFYSVAEHAIMVSNICDPKDALWGLLHDATEAYLVDLPRPLKRHSSLGSEYQKIESKLQAVICQAFWLSPQQPESVSIADKVALGIEARDLMPRHPAWDKWISIIGQCPYSVHVPLSPNDAEHYFLHRFAQVTGGAR